MKNILPILIMLFPASALFAQTFEVPKDYEMKSEEDFAKYEKDIIKCADWMIATPVNKDAEKRKEAKAFLVTWITGSPKVMIGIKAEIVTFAENPELLAIFLAGWTKYALESGKADDQVNGNLKGLEAVIKFYEKNKKALGEDKNVEKYVKMKEKGTLEDYVKKNA